MAHTTHTTARPRLRTLDLTYIALFTVLITVCAWVTIPTAAISFTLQTFGIFAAVLTLGGRRGSLAVLVYLLLGAVGLPVFSGFQSTGALLGATGGYILGFLGSALTYWLVTTLVRKDTLPVRLIACALGLAVCYAFGTAWFLLGYSGGSMSLGKALSLCVIPFILPDLVKIGLAAALSQRVKKYLK